MIKNFKGVPVHVMKAYRCVEVQLHSFFISTLYGDCSASCLRCLSPQERAPIPTELEAWVVLRVGLDILEKRKISFTTTNQQNAQKLVP